MSTTDTPATQNGVTLVTRTGTPKTRYSHHERLSLLGGTQADLDAFVALFCPDRPLYAATRSDSDDPRAWTTPRGRLPDSEVLRHLCGDLTPGIKPRWIAPRCWEVTKWIGLDVDYRGDQADFLRRCATVMQALRDLGVPEAAVLESETPSGGRHFRFFLTGKVPAADIPKLFAMVGIHETPGQIEVFPKQNQGMRLPFGHIPGREHDPQQWLVFIRSCRKGEFPKVCWLTCLRKAEAIFRETLHGGAPRAVAPARIAAAARGYSVGGSRSAATWRFLGTPRRLRTPGVPAIGGALRYQELLSRPVADPGEAVELWNLGLRLEGTRVEVTKRLAWHLLFVRKLSVKDAIRDLVAWVYETGRKTSKDVRADLRHGKRAVEQETVRIVEWMSAKHRPAVPIIQDKTRFSKPEIQWVRERLGDLAKNATLVTVALNFLRFAKLYGEPLTNGWSVRAAVNGVIRKWPGCRGMGYKPLLDALKDCGFVKMTREKRQTSNGTGRPRTYLVCVPPDLRLGATMLEEEAKTAILGSGSETPDDPGFPQSPDWDTYMRSIFPPRRDHTQCEEEAAAQETNEITATSSRKLDLARACSPPGLLKAEALTVASLECVMAIRHARERIRKLHGPVPSHPPQVMIVPIVRSAMRNERRGHRLGRHRPQWLRPPPRSPTAAEDEKRDEL